MDAPEQLVLALLTWLEAGPRPYGEVMDAWRTSCPRLPVWEDAVDLGLVRYADAMVELTDAGRERLAAGSASLRSDFRLRHAPGTAPGENGAAGED